jgi:hypothetical protein
MFKTCLNIQKRQDLDDFVCFNIVPMIRTYLPAPNVTEFYCFVLLSLASAEVTLSKRKLYLTDAYTFLRYLAVGTDTKRRYLETSGGKV